MKQTLPRFLTASDSANNKDYNSYAYSVLPGERALHIVRSYNMIDIINLPENKDSYNFLYTPKSTGMPEFYRFSIVDNLDLKEEFMQQVFKAMSVWYKKALDTEQYLFSNEKIEKTEPPILKEYTKKIKGLVVIYSKEADKWIYIYKDHVRVFESDEKGTAWLTGKFKLNNSDLTEGKVNISEDVDAAIIRRCEEI